MKELGAEEIEAIFSLAENLTGSCQKGRFRKEILVSNVQRRMDETGHSSLADYLNEVASNDEELECLISALTIHTTSWFREASHFHILKKYYSELQFAHKSIQILNLACSSGQESYSLALVFEALRRSEKIADYKIVSHDIDPLVIRQAKTAIYPDEGLAKIPREYQAFTMLGSGPTKGLFTFDKAIRERCVFEVGDLRNFSAELNKNQDLVVCRNVLIYFDAKQVDAIIHNMTRYLAPKGLLCLGHNDIANISRIASLSKVDESIYKLIDHDAKLPLLVKKTTAVIAAKPETRPQLLIIDSEDSIAQLLKVAVKLSIDCHCVASTQEAESFLKQHAVDLISLRLDCDRAMSWLGNFRRANQTTPIMLIGDAHSDGKEKIVGALGNGVQDFLELAVLRRDPHECREKFLSLYNDTRDVGPGPKAKALRGKPSFTPELLLIGASTGGTTALCKLLSNWPKDSPPVMVVQHINEYFSADFGKRLAIQSGLKLWQEALPTKLAPGSLYMSLHKQHIELQNSRSGPVALLTDRAERNRHKPSVDILFESAEFMAKRTFAILLTGMGADGASGLEKLYHAGAFTMAQDKESSVVYGMPRVAVERSAVHFQGNLDEIRHLIINSLSSSSKSLAV